MAEGVGILGGSVNELIHLKLLLHLIFLNLSLWVHKFHMD